MLHVIYRLSDNGYAKEKFAFATKMYCLRNFLDAFTTSDDYLWKFHLLIDTTNLKQETRDEATTIANELDFPIVFHSAGSSAGSWRLANEYLDNCSDIKNEDCVYFLEDDYLHRKGSLGVLIEGLERADYVSLYDHADKYIPSGNGGNPYIDETGGEVTKVILTKSTHWKLTNSTTMTLATKVFTLREDKPIWEKYTMGTYPHDFNAFIELRQKGRSLITPIPGWSTHCEPKWASPLINWSSI